MSDKPKHSKLPWKVSPAVIRGRNPHRWVLMVAEPEGESVYIAEGAGRLLSDPYEESRANRDLILKAVNSHDELVGALRCCQTVLSQLLETEHRTCTDWINARHARNLAINAIENAGAAL